MINLGLDVKQKLLFNVHDTNAYESGVNTVNADSLHVIELEFITA